MAQKRDYYEVLGLEKGASPQEIKGAYRKKAMEHHPDRNPGDAQAEEKFKSVAEAFQILSDDQKRTVYDQYGHDSPNFNFANANDLFRGFEEFFRSPQAPSNRERDIRMRLGVLFLDAIHGVETPLTVTRNVKCNPCDGSGAAPGTKVTTCSTCKGQGKILHRQGFFNIEVQCTACRGTGSLIPTPCNSCKGKGTLPTPIILRVHVPPGVDTNQTLRIAGAGQQFGKHKAGDLYVQLTVTPHPTFVRKGTHILSKLSLSMFEAALGTEVTVETVHGKRKVTVPEGVQSGAVLKLKQEGVPHAQGRGDHFLQLEVVIPKKLTKTQRVALMEALEAFEK